MASDSFETFQRRSRCEVARPECMRIRRIWEEIVTFRGPFCVGVVQCLQVTGRRRVE